MKRVLGLIGIAALSACFEERAVDTREPDTGEQLEDLTIKECGEMTKPFTKPATCADPTGMTDAQKKAKCKAVKDVALNDYKKQFGKEPNCSGGWVFGPGALLDACIKDSGKNLCKLASTTGTDEGWPKSDNYSQCLNDWVIYCTDSYPAEMGIAANPKGAVCFHKDLDYGRLSKDSYTAREVCQRLQNGGKDFPPKCDDELCKPKMKPGTKKGGGTSCASARSGDAVVSATPVPCTEEPAQCEACDPAIDPDCSYDVSCGCEVCAPDDPNPACSEDLDCSMPTPTPTPTATPYPTPNPTPTATPNPTPNPTPTATPNPTPTTTPYPTPTATPYPTPTATPYPTPNPTPTTTPYPTPTATPNPTPTATPYPTPTATPYPTPIATATPSPTPLATPFATRARVPYASAPF